MSKTTADFCEDCYKVMKDMAESLTAKGYEAKHFVNINGDNTCTVQVIDEDGDPCEYVAIFERI